MELLKLSDSNYIPIHHITRSSRHANYMYIHYQWEGTTYYYRTIIKDDSTLEQELQARLINMTPTKGFTNAI